ncbi:rhodanese-like domain-containing protein [Mycolicibacterium septicum]|uniref:Rhodanese-like domain-containing protein n=1 Tax=Mycolicibacterium septicum TaxID=98668 RepID=A0ABW9LRZ2_9MYCO
MSFTDDHVIPIVDEGLGNSAYLVDLGDGRALAVDASRDLRALRAAARRRGLAVTFAADTHLHADFLSGAVQLHRDSGATILASAAGNRMFDHVGLGDNDETDLGGLRLRTLSTPGHTDEHVSFILLDGDREVGVFTGGSLIVGSAARTDLLGAERAAELARAQFHSLRRLATLPDDVAVWPTHGAGSFCSAPPGADRISTIGAEKAANPLMSAPDEDTFAHQLLASLGTYPDYFRRLGDINRRGPRVITGEPVLPALTPKDIDAAITDGGFVVDVRPASAFAQGHVPGALSIPLRGQFATWLGWLVPAGTPLVFILDEDQSVHEIVWQAMKIGYEQLTGQLAGGMAAWRADGRPQQHLTFAHAEKLPESTYLDVRQDAEFAAGHVDGALHIELGALGDHTSAVPDGAVIACGHGERAMTAASVLQRRGVQDLAVLDGGPSDYAETHGRAIKTGC